MAISLCTSLCHAVTSTRLLVQKLQAKARKSDCEQKAQNQVSEGGDWGVEEREGSDAYLIEHLQGVDAGANIIFSLHAEFGNDLHPPGTSTTPTGETLHKITHPRGYTQVFFPANKLQQCAHQSMMVRMLVMMMVQQCSGDGEGAGV